MTSREQEDRIQDKIRDVTNGFIDLSNEMSLHGVPTSEILGSMFTVAFAMIKVLKRNGVPFSDIEEVIMIAHENALLLDGRMFKNEN